MFSVVLTLISTLVYSTALWTVSAAPVQKVTPPNMCPFEEHRQWGVPESRVCVASHFLHHCYACCSLNCDWYGICNIIEVNVLIKVLFCFRHIFLGFTKCGRYVLSYTSDYGEDDDFSFYIYHLYWWEFNLHSRLKQVKTADFHMVKDLLYATSSVVYSINFFSELSCMAHFVTFAYFL